VNAQRRVAKPRRLASEATRHSIFIRMGDYQQLIATNNTRRSIFITKGGILNGAEGGSYCYVVRPLATLFYIRMQNTRRNLHAASSCHSSGVVQVDSRGAWRSRAGSITVDNIHSDPSTIGQDSEPIAFVSGQSASGSLDRLGMSENRSSGSLIGNPLVFLVPLLVRAPIGAP